MGFLFPSRSQTTALSESGSIPKEALGIEMQMWAMNIPFGFRIPVSSTVTQIVLESELVIQNHKYVPHPVNGFSLLRVRRQWNSRSTIK